MGTLSDIKDLLPAGIARDAWVTENEMRGEKVARYRRYMDGDFDNTLTDEMKAMLRIDYTAALSANYCDTIVSTMTDRMYVEDINTDSEDADTWIQEFLEANRFDGFQMDVHEAGISDGDTYVMQYYDDLQGRVVMVHEPAWDGTNGMLVVHNRTDHMQIDVAIKVWQITRNSSRDTTRVNVYYPDRVERYYSVTDTGGGLMRYDLDGQPFMLPWRMTNGEPIGVPVVQFPNRARKNENNGLSELENVIPLQDALNRTVYSMIMSAELTAFQVRYAIGVPVPKAIAPGVILNIHAGRETNGDPVVPTAEQTLKWFDSIRFGAFEQGEIVPFIQQANFIIDQIRAVTRTPHPEQVSAHVSGESRKQSEIGLLGKVKRAQVKFGNAWENCIKLAARIQSAYGEQPPAFEQCYTQWMDAQIRNAAETVDNALKIMSALGKTPTSQRLFLKLTQSATGLSFQEIEDVIAGLEDDMQTQRDQMATLGVTGMSNGVTNTTARPQNANRQPAQSGVS